MSGFERNKESNGSHEGGNIPVFFHVDDILHLYKGMDRQNAFGSVESFGILAD